MALVQTLGLTAGTYAAFARVDDGCQITETNESNNTTPAPGVGFTVTGERPIPTWWLRAAPRRPASSSWGTITVSATVRNDGAGGADIPPSSCTGTTARAAGMTVSMTR